MFRQMLSAFSSAYGGRAVATRREKKCVATRKKRNEKRLGWCFCSIIRKGKLKQSSRLRCYACCSELRSNDKKANTHTQRAVCVHLKTITANDELDLVY